MLQDRYQEGSRNLWKLIWTGLEALTRSAASAVAFPTAWDLQGSIGQQLGSNRRVLPCESQAVREAAIAADLIKASRSLVLRAFAELLVVLERFFGRVIRMHG